MISQKHLTEQGIVAFYKRCKPMEYQVILRVFLLTYVKSPRKLCKSEISDGVPQRSGLEPLLFLIYLTVNGVAVNMLLMCKLFVNLSWLNTLMLS